MLIPIRASRGLVGRAIASLGWAASTLPAHGLILPAPGSATQVPVPVVVGVSVVKNWSGPLLVEVGWVVWVVRMVEVVWWVVPVAVGRRGRWWAWHPLREVMGRGKRGVVVVMVGVVVVSMVWLVWRRVEVRRQRVWVRGGRQGDGRALSHGAVLRQGGGSSA